MAAALPGKARSFLRPKQVNHVTVTRAGELANEGLTAVQFLFILAEKIRHPPKIPVRRVADMGVVYSWRSACIGSRRAARAAGYKPARRPISAAKMSEPMASHGGTTESCPIPVTPWLIR